MLPADDVSVLLQASLAHNGLEAVEPGESGPLQTDSVSTVGPAPRSPRTLPQHWTLTTGSQGATSPESPDSDAGSCVSLCCRSMTSTGQVLCDVGHAPQPCLEACAFITSSFPRFAVRRVMRKWLHEMEAGALSPLRFPNEHSVLSAWSGARDRKGTRPVTGGSQARKRPSAQW